MISLAFRKFPFSTLVLVEHNNKTVNSTIRKLMKAASNLQQPNHILITGKDLSPVVASIQKILGQSAVQKIITAESSALQHPLAENYDHIIKSLIQKYKYNNVMALASSFGKDVIPRVAAKFDCQAITDVTEIEGKNTFVRPTYAGNALSKVQSNCPIQFLTIRPTSFEQVPEGTCQKVEIEKFEFKDVAIKTQFVSSLQSDSGKPDLSTAKAVVSGGRALKSKQNFKIIEDLASALNGAVGASRAAVDAGYCPNQIQVGQTGKIVAPQLYVAVGISGAVQHLAGMKDSKVIVAINSKNQEPIFEIATYGLIGDLFKIVPELTEKLNKLKN